MIAKLTGLKSSSPVIEGSDGVSLEPTEFGDGELGTVKSTKSVTPLLGELRIGNFGHGFFLSEERNPPAYRPHQHGQIERLPSTDVFSKLDQQHQERAALLSELHRLIDLVNEEGPKPSFVGAFSCRRHSKALTLALKIRQTTCDDRPA